LQSLDDQLLEVRLGLVLLHHPRNELGAKQLALLHEPVVLQHVYQQVLPCFVRLWVSKHSV